MKRTLLAAAITLAAATAQAADPRLTVYSGDYDAVVQSEAMPGSPGFALYEATIGFDLRSGANRVSLVSGSVAVMTPS